MPITGKQRAQRISRSYHGRPDPNIAWKRTLGLVGLVAALLYGAWVFTGYGKKQISTGDLSQAHSHLNDSGCERCHLPFQTIRFDSLWGTDKDIVRLNNDACNGACHKVSDHFLSRTQPSILERETCSRCHQEHLGKHRSLLDIADSDCTRCHSDLTSSSTSPPNGLTVATNFSSEHPKLSFEKWTEDPGTILFSHVQHMRPGQPKTPRDATAKRLVDLAPEFRAKFQARANADGFIQLRCSDCHVRDVPVPGMDELELPGGGLAASQKAIQSSSHMLYQPVDFEKHCVACHSLNELPHGLNREQTVNALHQRISAVSVEDAEKLLKQDSAKLPAKVEELMRDRMGRAAILESHVEEACKKCHALAPPASPNVVMPSQIPKRWMGDAAFTHGKHLMVACQDCHAAAYAQSDAAVHSESDANQIMIGGLETCRKCHIQDSHLRTQAFASQPHVASADCIDCHRYHVDPPGHPARSPASGIEPSVNAEARIQWLQRVSSTR